VIATTDFFTPMVDDPVDFGRIAATNAISDVYAMGGRPILAPAIFGIPLGIIEPDIVGRILRGGAEICAGAGIPVAVATRSTRPSRSTGVRRSASAVGRRGAATPTR
jgi:selenide,water dikinase